MKPVHHPHQRLRMGDSETVVCLDPSTSRLLKYYEVHTHTDAAVKCVGIAERGSAQGDVADLYCAAQPDQLESLFANSVGLHAPECWLD
jgi:hypothetical protein